MTTTSLTVPCPACGTATPGRFCPSCGADAHVHAAPTGAPPQATQSGVGTGPRSGAGEGRSWMPAAIVGGVAALIAAVVVVVLVVAGGSPEKPATRKTAPNGNLRAVQLAGQPLYGPRLGARFIVFTPAGWAPGTFKSPISLRGQLTATSPQDSGTSVTVGELNRTGTLKHQAQSIGDQLKSSSGYKPTGSQATRFPGGVPGWRVSYELGATSQLVYLVDICTRRFAVIGVTRPELLSQLKQRFSLTAGSLQVSC